MLKSLFAGLKESVKDRRRLASSSNCSGVAMCPYARVDCRREVAGLGLDLIADSEDGDLALSNSERPKMKGRKRWEVLKVHVGILAQRT
jgi:hypothetical protein